MDNAKSLIIPESVNVGIILINFLDKTKEPHGEDWIGEEIKR